MRCISYLWTFSGATFLGTRLSTPRIWTSLNRLWRDFVGDQGTKTIFTNSFMISPVVVHLGTPISSWPTHRTRTSLWCHQGQSYHEIRRPVIRSYFIVDRNAKETFTNSILISCVTVAGFPNVDSYSRQLMSVDSQAEGIDFFLTYYHR